MSEELREKVRKIVQRRDLCSCMNDTKWRELRSAMMNEMPFQPPYIVKFLFDDDYDSEPDDVFHPCDWHYAYSAEEYGCFDAAFAIEWIKVRPRYLVSRGRLVPPGAVDAEGEFVGILKKYSIPYEKIGGTYIIRGYR